MTRDELRVRLAEKGIETRTFFIPINLQPIYFKEHGQSYPVSEDLCSRGMYLPSSAGLTEEQIKFVSDSIRECAG